MKPIRKDEQEYLKNYIQKKFNSRRSILETERQVDIDKSVEQNLTKFKKGLPGVEKYIKDIQKLNDDYQSFKQNMNKMLESKKDNLTNTADLLEKKLETDYKNGITGSTEDINKRIKIYGKNKVSFN